MGNNNLLNCVGIFLQVLQPRPHFWSNFRPQDGTQSEVELQLYEALCQFLAIWWPTVGLDFDLGCAISGNSFLHKLVCLTAVAAAYQLGNTSSRTITEVKQR